uniref:Uncharacterized protein n=1 Tax=Octopus bimaculoides TaxID=37653 RepID=A0A0L8HA96_OCTBM
MTTVNSKITQVGRDGEPVLTAGGFTDKYTSSPHLILAHVLTSERYIAEKLCRIKDETNAFRTDLSLKKFESSEQAALSRRGVGTTLR